MLDILRYENLTPFPQENVDYWIRTTIGSQGPAQSLVTLLMNGILVSYFTPYRALSGQSPSVA